MKRLRLSGSREPETCSADTVVPRMTKRSTPASTTVFHRSWVRRRQRSGHRHARGADPLQPRRDEFGDDRGRVDLLEATSRPPAFQFGYLAELRRGILVSGPQPLQVQDPDAAQPADGDGRLRRAHGVHRRGEHRDVEVVGVELPRGRDFVGIPGSPARHHRDVVQCVGAPRPLAPSDLDFAHASSLPCGPSRPTVGGQACHGSLTAGRQAKSRDGAGASRAGRGVGRTRGPSNAGATG